MEEVLYDSDDHQKHDDYILAITGVEVPGESENKVLNKPKANGVSLDEGGAFDLTEHKARRGGEVWRIKAGVRRVYFALVHRTWTPTGTGTRR